MTELTVQAVYNFVLDALRRHGASQFTQQSLLVSDLDGDIRWAVSDCPCDIDRHALYWVEQEVRQVWAGSYAEHTFERRHRPDLWITVVRKRDG